MRPLVSVNICAFNSARHIVDTLHSVFNQTFQDFEVVVVDDGSTDGTPELIERHFSDPRIAIVRQHHGTLRMARPVALAHSTGRFIAFLDSDDLWMPDKLTRQVATISRMPAAGLVFCECELIDGSSVPIGLFSDRFGGPPAQLRGTSGYAELLRRGNLIGSPTPLARAEALRAVGGFNHAYQYVNDFDMWLRLARRFGLIYSEEVLARYRIHGAQFTQRHPDITLAELSALLRPIYLSASYPDEVRRAVGDNLFGQHRLAWRDLRKQRRMAPAVCAALGVCGYRDRVSDFCRHRLWQSPVGPLMEAAIRFYRRCVGEVRHAAALLRAPSDAPCDSTHVWVDGTPLAATRAGYFTFLSELIRTVARYDKCVVHVTSNRAGRAALCARLGSDAARLRFHPAGWRCMHWTELYTRLGGCGGSVSSRSRLSLAARLIRFLWRRLPAPGSAGPVENTIEVIAWRGRFRWRTSRRIAIVHDMTTRIHPELHTAANVAEFDEFLGYVQRHAHVIATPSAHSRDDIINRIAVYPDSVVTIPTPVHPLFARPNFSRGFVAYHSIEGAYVLCVGTVEPRKNLRRLVKAFELLRHEPLAQRLKLVIAGPPGWDPTFDEFLHASDVAQRVRMTGFVPLEHLPSLYHFAEAVICPSLYEGFGIPVLEAMCCSASVLASRTSALPEVLGPDGITFDPYDTEEIARALLTVLALSPQEAAEYRRARRLRAEAHLARFERESALPGIAVAPVVVAT
jgi:glycosyltransferase involved in cell wall biosynthesis